MCVKKRDQLSDFLYVKFGVDKKQFQSVASFVFDIAYNSYGSDNTAIMMFVSSLGDDVSEIKKWLVYHPSMYNYLSLDLQKNKEILSATIEGIEMKRVIDSNYEPYIGFYDIVRDEKDKVAAVKEIFGNFACFDDILKLLIFEEYHRDRTCEIMNSFKWKLFEHLELLETFISFYGLKGFLEEYVDDEEFFKRLIEVDAKFILLASDKLKNNRKLVSYAIDKEPELAFVLNLENDVEYLSVAINSFRRRHDEQNDWMFSF